jgi:hypothetical protein
VAVAVVNEDGMSSETVATAAVALSVAVAGAQNFGARVLQIETRIPAGVHRLNADELRQLLIGKMLVPAQRIPNRRDECDEYFPRSGGWSKCGNPSGVVPYPYFSKVVEYKNSYFCVNVESFKYRRFSILYRDSANRYYIFHRYSYRFKPSLIEVRISN